MQSLKPSPNKEQWPKQAVKQVECRKRDLVVRISNWMRQSIDTGEPEYDVEVYIGGVYDWNESEVFSLHQYGSKAKCKELAIAYAKAQIEKLL